MYDIKSESFCFSKRLVKPNKFIFVQCVTESFNWWISVHLHHFHKKKKQKKNKRKANKNCNKAHILKIMNFCFNLNWVVFRVQSGINQYGFVNLNNDAYIWLNFISNANWIVFYNSFPLFGRKQALFYHMITTWTSGIN